MICNGYDKVLELRDRDLVDLRDARGTTIRVTRGTLWITQANDTRDIVLRSGDVWTVERRGLTMIESQGDSTMCLAGVAGRDASARSPARVGWRKRLEAFVAVAAERWMTRHRLPYL